MSERKYTVAEIDDLRRAIEHKWLWGSYRSTSGPMFSRQYQEPEKTKCIEELVRTAMLAGHTAEDLYASETITLTPEQSAKEQEGTTKVEP